MDKKQFLKLLKGGTEDKELKVQVLQYFIDHYPVLINVKHPLVNVTVGNTWTTLAGYKVKEDKLAMNKLDENYQKLVDRIDEITNFK